MNREERIKELDKLINNRVNLSNLSSELSSNQEEINNLQKENARLKALNKKYEDTLNSIRANYWPTKAAKEAQKALKEK